MSRRRGRLGLLSALAVALAAAPPAWGQGGSGSLVADATVVNATAVVTPLRNLVFGTVPRGVATTVAPTAAAAGQWQVSGSANAFVLITLTLPSQLTNVQAAPGVTMPITFGATSARWRRANNNPAGATAFNPNAGTIGRLGPPANPTLYVWLGGTVTPSATQLPGIYTGNAILTIVVF
ncbi:MAG TPA: hypothetical protein VNK43_10210 [Gemmatimonadales bacterium]|nr:hypothetical protein [Gemmatimonadales bacterium]